VNGNLTPAEEAPEAGADGSGTYRGPTCSHPHNLPYNDECAVWWLQGTPEWRLAHTNLPEVEDAQ
jgi:hypothetical protein